MWGGQKIPKGLVVDLKDSRKPLERFMARRTRSDTHAFLTAYSGSTAMAAWRGAPRGRDSVLRLCVFTW